MSNPSTSSSPAIPGNPSNQQPQQHHTAVQISQLPVATPAPQIAAPQRNKPNLDILHGPRKQYITVAVPLYEAAMKGDWKAVEPMLVEKRHLVRAAITENEETLLHVAASAESTKDVEDFVKNLVKLMEKADLELQNKTWDTALSSAAAAGNIETAKTMVGKNPALTEMPNIQNVLPLYMAALFAKADMVRYLYGLSKKMAGDFWTDDNRGWVIQKCVEADIFDVALKILNDCPKLDLKNRLLMDVLFALAQKPHKLEEKKTNMIFTNIKSIFAAPDKKESEALQLLKITSFLPAARCGGERRVHSGIC